MVLVLLNETKMQVMGGLNLLAQRIAIDIPEHFNSVTEAAEQSDQFVLVERHSVSRDGQNNRLYSRT
jgi:hypothetical protein